MPEILNPGNFQRQFLERPRNPCREKVDDQDLQHDRDKEVAGIAPTKAKKHDQRLGITTATFTWQVVIIFRCRFV